MLAIAAIGIAVNLVSMRLLPQDSSDSLNVRGAYLGGSLAVIVAAGIIMATG